MNRLSFLKKLGLGTTAIIVAPKIIAEVHSSNVKEIKSDSSITSDFTVGLFYEKEEVSYWDYRRMGTSLYLEKGVFRFRPVIFPQTPKVRAIRVDEVRVFDENGKLAGIFPMGLNEVFHGTFTVQW